MTKLAYSSWNIAILGLNQPQKPVARLWVKWCHESGDGGGVFHGSNIPDKSASKFVEFEGELWIFQTAGKRACFPRAQPFAYNCRSGSGISGVGR